MQRAKAYPSSVTQAVHYPSEIERESHVAHTRCSRSVSCSNQPPVCSRLSRRVPVQLSHLKMVHKMVPRVPSCLFVLFTTLLNMPCFVCRTKPPHIFLQ